MKPKRGQKQCSNCSTIVGARSLACKNCGHQFIKSAPTTKAKLKKMRAKKTEKFSHNIDWKELSSGDKIKVVGRSGNYYIGDNGEKQYMTDAGIYKIITVKDDGLIVYGMNGGFGYIYMGPEKRSNDVPNMYRSPHKILKVNSASV